MRTKVLIEVYGGLVQRVASNRNMDVYLIDHDNLKEGDDPKNASEPYASSVIKNVEREVNRALKEYKPGGDRE